MYDSDDILLIGGSGVHRSVIYTKLAPLGYTRDQVADLTEEQVKTIMATNAKAPISAPKPQPAVVALQPQVRSGLIDLDSLDAAPDTEVMSNGAVAASIPPPSVVQPVGALPPLPGVKPPPKPPGPKNAYRDQDPVVEKPIPQQSSAVHTRSDPKRLLAILEAAATMLGGKKISAAAREQAKKLVVEHALQKAFLVLHPKEAAKVFDSEQETPSIDGGVILVIERDATTTHIVTSRGVISIPSPTFTIERLQEPS